MKRSIAIALLLFIALLFGETPGMSRQTKSSHGGTSAPPAVSGAWHLIANTSATGSGSSPLTTPAINDTGADLIVVNVAAGNPAGLTISDSLSNTQWEVGPIASDTSDILFYIHQPTTGAAHTFTISNGATYISHMDVQAWSGSTSSSEVLDHCASTIGSGSTIAAGSLTPSAANSLIIAGTEASGGTAANAPTIDSGFLVSGNAALVPNVHFGGGMAYLVQTTATAVNPTWTYSASLGGSSAVLAVFRSSGAGAICNELTISNLTLSPTTYTPNTPNATVGAVSATLSPAIPFYGSYAVSGNNSGGFHLVGTTLQTNSAGTTGAGPYNDVTITASQPGVTSSSINPTLSGTGGGGGPPANAQIAGFTTQVVKVDFTTVNASTWANSNIVGCGASTSTPNVPSSWHFENRFYGHGGGPLPCNRSIITTDTAGGGNQALKLFMTVADFASYYSGGANAYYTLTYFGFPYYNAGTGNPTPWLPNEIYTKVTFREDAGSLNQGVIGGQVIYGDDVWWAQNTTFGAGYVDQNYGELDPNNSQMQISLWPGPGGSVVFGYPHWPDFTNYHTLETLVTSDESSNQILCEWLDGTFKLCLTNNSYPSSTYYLNRDRSVYMTIGIGPPIPATINNDLNIWIKSLEIWSCANFASSTCRGAGPTLYGPDGTGLTYWH